MKKQKMLLLPAAMLLCFLLISGCTQNTPSPVKVTIQDILTRAKNIGPVKYDVVTSFTVNGSGMPNRTSTIWEEPPYMKVELLLGNTSAVYITRPDGTYVRNPGEHTFNKTTSHSSDQPLENQSALLSNISFQVVGNETINGNVTTILQYTTNESGSPTTMKVWIWDDKGIPVKSQSTVFMGKMPFITITMYEHFVFGEIPLSEFSVS
jgi:outer membrane lipoprotein-sorting protein